MKSSLIPTKSLFCESAKYKSKSKMSSGFTPMSVEIRSIKASSCFDRIFASLLRVSRAIYSLRVDEKIGLSSVSVFGSNLFLSVLKWMARFGIFKRGFLDYQSLEVYFSPSL